MTSREGGRELLVQVLNDKLFVPPNCGGYLVLGSMCWA